MKSFLRIRRLAEKASISPGAAVTSPVLGLVRIDLKLPSLRFLITWRAKKPFA